MKSLSSRFLLPFGFFAVLISGLVFYQTFEASRKHAYQLIGRQTAVALEFNLAIREYAAEKIRPVMAKLVGKDDFIPETMSTSFISRNIFEEARKRFPDLLVRFSSENPRNPINLANSDELRMIEYFRNNPEVEWQTEEIQIDGNRYLAHFTPKWMKQECLRCHGDPKDAPAELVKRYGAMASFHRTAGEVAGLDMVAVPVETANAALASELRSQSMTLAAGLVLLFGSIFLVFRFTVTRRLQAMARHFNAIAAHAESPSMKPVEVKGDDEISVVGVAFNRLIDQLRSTQASLEQRVSQRTDELRNVNEQLQLELAERKRTNDALKESEERYRLIFNHAPLGIMHFDLKGIVRDFNDKFAEIMGAPRENILGFDMLARLREPAFLQAVKDALAGELGYYEGDYLSITGGKTTPMRAIYKRITAEDGRFLGAVGLFEDITARKQAEKALQESQRMLKSVLDTIPVRVFWKDLESNYLGCNRAFALDAGLQSTEEVFGRNDSEMGWAEQADLYRSDDRRIIESGVPILGTEELLNTPAGERIWLRVNKVPLIDADGRTKGVLGTYEDITEHKQAEEALKESQQQLADIIDFLPDATLVIDRAGKVIAWNRAMEEMTGVRAQDMLGKGNHEYALPLYGERRPILIDLVLEPRKEAEAKYFGLERKDAVLAGEAYTPALKAGEVYLFGTASILRDSKGNIVGAIESIRDITERKRVAEALVRAEEKYRSIFENAIEGIFQTTIEGRIISANPALARIFGYDSPEEAMNAIADISREYVNPTRRSELLRLVEEQNKVQEFEAQFLRKDRTIAWVTFNIRAVRDANGKMLYLEGTAQDITERKALESRLARAQKMEAIGTLAGGIAHDFNNILAAIIGYAEIIKVKFDQPALQVYLEQILSSSYRAKDLIGQILTFSRASEQQRKPVDMTSLVKETLKLLRATLPSTIAFRQNITSGAHAILADPTQIHQVLMNLCTNAAHAMRERGGVLGMGLDNVEIGPHTRPAQADLSPGPYVKLAVSDTGTGIVPEVMHRIFDPFFTTKKTGEGTGLGLSVVYGIVKGCGGTVAVQSEPGAGSVFSVYLPAIRHGAELKMEATEAVPTGIEQILFVDDEDILVTMWQQLLGDLGYRVTATTRSNKALELFRNRPDQFDLVITDMTMPGMTGIDLSREILKIRPDIPIVLCTGFSELITEEKAKAIGIREFVMKPLGLKSIAELIRKALRENGS